MEELHSTAVLDDEIRTDARKKAERILAKADTDSKALLDGVQARIADAQKKASDASHERIALYEKNINASLPLEKQRYLVSYIHSAVVDQINVYLASLPEEKKLDVIKTLVERAKPVLAGKSVSAEVVGFDVKKAEDMLAKTLGIKVNTCNKAEPIVISDDAVDGIEKREGILVKTDDGKIVCRFTMDEKIREVLDTQSFELSSTLFCGRLPE
jgi:V/A-type H+-transporting ATPase subunit E